MKSAVTRISLLLAILPILGSLPAKQAHAQSIQSAPDGTGTVVMPAGNRYDITGGTPSVDGANLFHSFTQFSLDQSQIANFKSKPSIRFFRASSSFTDHNGINASISSVGGVGGGSITIRHGGNGITPFIVGNATANGTDAAITTGADNKITSGSFPGIYIQKDIGIITRPLPDVTLPSLVATPKLQTSQYLQPSFLADLPSFYIDTIVSQLEGIFTHEFEGYLGRENTPIKSLTQISNTIGKIERATGVKPAVIYAVFVPPNIAPNAALRSDLAPRWAQHQAGISGNIRSQDSDELELILVSAKGQPIRKRLDGVTRQQVVKVAKQFRAEVSKVTSRRSYKAVGQQMYQWLIAPLEADLQALRIQNLTFIMDAGLRSVPLAALFDGQKFLVERYSLGLMPSMSLTDTRYVNIKDTSVLAMGAEAFKEQSFLPAVPVELSEITQNLWRGKSLLNEDFTLDNLQSQRGIQPFGIVHMATHAEFLPGAPGNSYIQLWDSKLQVDQLSRLGWNHPPVELLVLSACKTAQGNEQVELGFAGLGVQAGVKSALASLWYVSDEGTLALMTDFYEELKQAPVKAEALRRAQVAMLKGQVRLKGGGLRTPRGNVPLPPSLARLGDQNLSHPKFWAAFTIIGNPW